MVVIFSVSPRVPVALFPGQYLVLSVLLIFTILGHVVISHCSFNLHFLDDKRRWALVCEVTDRSYCFACEMSIQLLFCPYFNLVGLFVFLLLNCRSHCVFQICPLSDKCFASICGLPIHFNGVFWWASVFNLGKSNSSFFSSWLLLFGFCLINLCL